MTHPHGSDGLTPLGRFQDDFVAALSGVAPAQGNSGVSRLVAQPGFAVYRNTVAKGCIDALRANYPSVVRLVGEEWFRAAAALFARESAPTRASLLDYGAGFPLFLAGFVPAADLPYLPDVAALDRLWTESHLAADQPMLEAARFAALDISCLGGAVLSVHCAARWRWFDHHPALTIWRLNRDGQSLQERRSEAAEVIDWHPQGALLVRAGEIVSAIEVRRADCVFLDACSGGADLSTAVTATLAFDPDADLQDMMARLLPAGAFTDVLTTT